MIFCHFCHDFDDYHVIFIFYNFFLCFPLSFLNDYFLKIYKNFSYDLKYILFYTIFYHFLKMSFMISDKTARHDLAINFLSVYIQTQSTVTAVCSQKFPSHHVLPASSPPNSRANPREKEKKKMRKEKNSHQFRSSFNRDRT
jgi:hypothetical protein